MSDKEILDLIREHPDPCVTAVELATLVDMTSTGILNRLDVLKDEGCVQKKKVGSRAVVWWIED